MSLAYNLEVWAIRDAMRDALSSRTPRTAPQLFQAIRDDIGSIEERRLWRHLGWLVQRGIAVRLQPQYCNQTQLDDVGYLRGTGVEYPIDALEHERVELVRAGLCWDCREPNLDPTPRDGHSHYCVYCYTENDQALSQAIRDDRYASGVCTECAVVPPRAGHRLCEKCNASRSYRNRFYAVPRDADAWSLNWRAA